MMKIRVVGCQSSGSCMKFRPPELEELRMRQEMARSTRMELPSSAEEGGLLGSRQYREASLARADGVVLVQLQTFSGPAPPRPRPTKKWGHFLDGASAP